MTGSYVHPVGRSSILSEIRHNGIDNYLGAMFSNG